MLTTYLAITAFTALGATADAYGFVWAGRIWSNGGPRWDAVAMSVVTNTAGLACYLLTLRYLTKLGEIGVSLQAASWYLVTTVGVMLASGVAFEWSWLDHLLAVTSIGSLALLIVRHN
ncbi:hypothetical protein [Amycolatopsis sp. EV170708-02-1]|uniref:hypothetical protein n=1 Tax=Amycolatopsis sp. EV170708-02-1 TaxID=2919322 RepID=UPI001F0C75CF|nr:hypothetical protein [Amycolatopsis sp. EV170708-02-1]UMP06919.1 hypothetical protein MJQ72_19830 [Amycolatopsis sp. EV170708-02-1]